MSETFTKLFSSLTDSTIWAENDRTRIVWITMLAMADRHGYVGASIPGLAARARVPVEAVEVALAAFLAPDKYSRSQEFQGRRIEPADRGWMLLNYGRFRDMRDEESRREYERERKRAQRDKAGQSHDVPDCPAVSAQAEAEAEAEAEVKETTSVPDDFDTAWAAYPKRPNNPKAKALRAYRARLADGEDPVVILAGVHAYAAYVQREGTPSQFIKLAATFFGPDRPYLDDYAVPDSELITLYDPITGDPTPAFAREMRRASA